MFIMTIVIGIGMRSKKFRPNQAQKIRDTTVSGVCDETSSIMSFNSAAHFTFHMFHLEVIAYC